MTKEDALFFLGRFRTEGINEKLYDALGVAIEALNTQTKMHENRTETHACDLISRQAAIVYAISGRVRTLPTNEDGENWIRTEEVRQSLLTMPSAQPGWIPCSERLPEYGVAVLTYDGSCYSVEKRIATIRDDNEEPIPGEWWVSDDYDESDSEYYPNLRDGACIAWMPLPSPWKGVQE